jgi:hypothetical protein
MLRLSLVLVFAEGCGVAFQVNVRPCIRHMAWGRKQQHCTSEEAAATLVVRPAAAAKSMCCVMRPGTAGLGADAGSGGTIACTATGAEQQWGWVENEVRIM